jgi:hypothetical protein
MGRDGLFSQPQSTLLDLVPMLGLTSGGGVEGSIRDSTRGEDAAVGIKI